ncbi:response regulator [Tsuneonella aeria]|uniref:response regulator n=1 Tax=Tsuneonella aeria TaxID=1837929 RepID=UPI0019251AC6|nr:response regulator [Tsuneonella aeria]
MTCFLIVEDEPLIAMDLKFAFEDEGADAVTASTCDQALDALDQNVFAGAVLDVNLGHGQTCERTAAELKRRGIPFVLHTGDLNRVGEFLRGLDAPVLSKPLPAEDVVRYALTLLQ